MNDLNEVKYLICTSGQYCQSDSSGDYLSHSGDTDYVYDKINYDDSAELLGSDYFEEKKNACLLLNLENIIHVPKTVIDEVLSELHYLLSTAFLPVTKTIISEIFQNNKLQIEVFSS